jgi:transposase InsO family protein
VPPASDLGTTVTDTLDKNLGLKTFFNGTVNSASIVEIHGKQDQGDAAEGRDAARVRAMGIRDRPTSPGSPWQNGYAERLIGTLRRECLDQMVIFGEAHLRRILSAYAVYYNQARTHLALQKDAPLHRAVQRSGVIVAIPILAGLHHQYVRI